MAKESGFYDTAGEGSYRGNAKDRRVLGGGEEGGRWGCSGAWGGAVCGGDCLRVAYGNLQRCPPDADGRALKNVIIGGAVGGVAAVVLLSILLFLFFAGSKKTKKTQKGNG